MLNCIWSIKIKHVFHLLEWEDFCFWKLNLLFGFLLYTFWKADNCVANINYIFLLFLPLFKPDIFLLSGSPIKPFKKSCYLEKLTSHQINVFTYRYLERKKISYGKVFSGLKSTSLPPHHLSLKRLWNEMNILLKVFNNK